MSGLAINLYFIKHLRAGDPGYYSPRHRGTIDVWCDSQRWVYEQPKYWTRKAVKNAIVAAFDDPRSSTIKISGRWPSYTIEADL